MSRSAHAAEVGQSRAPLEPRTYGDILEATMAEVVVKGIGPPSSDEQIRAAVIVVVADGDPVPIAAGTARQGRMRK